MSYRIAADSSASMFELEGADFAYAPLKIITKEKEYVDTPELDVAQMMADLKTYKGTSGTSCPNMMEWLDAFGEAENIFAIAITSNLSGSCNAAMQAAQEYMQQHPERRVCVLDSLSAGPELRLIAENLRGSIDAGMAFEEIEAAAREYMKHTRLGFILPSLNNLARNGRVSPTVAKIAGVLGICLVGKASDVGTLQQENKCRGEKRSAEQLYANMKREGFAGGKVRIGHNLNLKLAEMFASLIREEYPDCDIEIRQNTGLCCFYAEEGGLMVGYETV
ncbi:MAG: DegV family protein [Clostridia bacterium]|nr:DegV family protein [Clostridia bacterium]